MLLTLVGKYLANIVIVYHREHICRNRLQRRAFDINQQTVDENILSTGILVHEIKAFVELVERVVFENYCSHFEFAAGINDSVFFTKSV